MKIIFENGEERNSYTSKHGRWEAGVVYVTKFKEVELPTVYIPRHVDAEMYSTESDLRPVLENFNRIVGWDWLKTAKLRFFPEKEPEDENYVIIQQRGNKTKPLWRIFAKMYVEPRFGLFNIPMSGLEQSFVTEIADRLDETRLNGVLVQFGDSDAVVTFDRPQILCLIHCLILEIHRRE